MRLVLFIFIPIVCLSFLVEKKGNTYVHCNDLNEIIRCASLDTIWSTDGSPKERFMNSTHYFLRYQVIRDKRVNEVSTSEVFHKVIHTEIIHNLPSPKAGIQLSQKIFSELRKCLNGWSLDSTIQQAAGSVKIKDYMFTNSEDETAVRLSVEKRTPKNYSLILSIY